MTYLSEKEEGVKFEPFNMSFEREARMIDKEGNFIFENKRNEKVNDAWMDGLEQDGMMQDQERVAYFYQRLQSFWSEDGKKDQEK